MIVTGGGHRHSPQTNNPAYLYSLVNSLTKFNKDKFEVLYWYWGLSGVV